MTGNDPNSAKYQESLGPEFIQNSRFHVNLSQEVIVITEDRFRLCLQSHAERLTAREKWIAPVSLLATFVVVLATSEFKNFVLPAATWQAVFVISSIGALVWSLATISRAYGSDCRVDTLVNEVKRSSDELKSTER